eukprot:1194489-Prorocentrum_minimum.AAC.6
MHERFVTALHARTLAPRSSRHPTACGSQSTPDRCQLSGALPRSLKSSRHLSSARARHGHRRIGLRCLCGSTRRARCPCIETVREKIGGRIEFSSGRVAAARSIGVFDVCSSPFQRERGLSVVDVRGTEVDVRGSAVDVRGSAVDVRGTNVDVRGTNVDVRGTNVDVIGTNADVRGNNVDVRGNTVDVRGNNVDPGRNGPLPERTEIRGARKESVGELNSPVTREPPAHPGCGTPREVSPPDD